MWRVNREITTLFGGARALLMQAAHPLIAAGARQTGGYRRDPWMRLIRTVRMQSMLVFGTTAMADEAATRINKLHRTISGVDTVTDEWYDALDYEQLLWVHLALETSTLDFYRLTVDDLSPTESDRYHRENKLVGEMLLLPSDFVPDRYVDAEAYVDDMIGSGRLHHSDVAQEVADLITGAAVPARIKPLWRFITFCAVGTLDPRLRDLYGLRWDGARERLLRANLAMLRGTVPVIPHRYRYILPARWADLRLANPLPVTRT